MTDNKSQLAQWNASSQTGWGTPLVSAELAIAAPAMLAALNATDKENERLRGMIEGYEQEEEAMRKQALADATQLAAKDKLLAMALVSLKDSLRKIEAYYEDTKGAYAGGVPFNILRPQLQLAIAALSQQDTDTTALAGEV